jgi:hypothetical protein
MAGLITQPLEAWMDAYDVCFKRVMGTKNAAVPPPKLLSVQGGIPECWDEADKATGNKTPHDTGEISIPLQNSEYGSLLQPLDEWMAVYKQCVDRIMGGKN